MSDLRKDLQKSKLPPVPSFATEGSAAKRAFGRRRLYTPLPWNQYFDSCEDVKISEGNVFRVYRSGKTGPLLILLHGGGYNGLTWALFSVNIIQTVECQVAAIDMRSHGNSVTTDDNDLSAETLSNDIINIIKVMCGDDPPPIILVGHSMGGAIAVHAAYKCAIPSLIGLVVIDVVEGTAMDALQSMQNVLRGRPMSFKTVKHSIEWCVRSGQVRNCESARISMPGQIKNVLTNKLATEEIQHSADEGSFSESDGNDVKQRVPLVRSNSIPEEAEGEEELGEGENTAKKSMDEDNVFKIPDTETKYVWRIDLSKTEKYWSGWFHGLSNMFLSCPAAKMLLLAGIDRLDKDLTIGQMQGKFQMQVLPQCGHAVHEDVPDKVSDVIASYMVRNKFVQPTDNFQITFPGC